MCVSEFATTGHSLSVKYCPVPCRSGCLAPCCSVFSHATELALSASATINFLHGTFICFLHAHNGGIERQPQTERRERTHAFALSLATARRTARRVVRSRMTCSRRN